MKFFPSRARQPEFPPVETADEDGLLIVGGRLTPEWVIEAYRRGIFPWPAVGFDGEYLAWYSPDPRAIVELDSLHVSRRLRRTLNSGKFEATCDRDFGSVIDACAAPRGKNNRSTWITPRMRRVYRQLHEMGVAHSVEVWHQGELAGGVYGVALGGFFAGESMFHYVRDASKAAVVFLVEHLRRRGCVLFDIQQHTAHMASMGATTIPRDEFLRRLKLAIDMPVTFGGDLELAE